MSDSSPIDGPAGMDFNPDPTFHAKARRLRAELAAAQARASSVACWHPDKHATHHAPHPATGRIVCWRCHPPPNPRTQREAAKNGACP